MSHANPEPDPWTQERLRLRDWFHENAPRLEAPYEAAVRLLHMPEFPARRHLLSHLVREIANGLPEAVKGCRVRRFDSTKALDSLAESWLREFQHVPSFTEPETLTPPSIAVPARLAQEVSELVRDHRSVEQTNRDKTALLIEALRPGTQELRAALEPVIREWGKVVRWFQRRTHLPRTGESADPDEAELQRQFRHFEDGLCGITEGHFQVVREIDSIVESSPPSKETLERLLPFLGGAEQLRYFFQHPRLEDPAWLLVLEAGRFFAQPPQPIIDQDKRIETHVRWPASEYLVRMAAYAGARETAVRIGQTIRSANTTVRDDLIDLASRLPPASTAVLVPVLMTSLRRTRWSWAPAEKLGALTASLAGSGEFAAAEQLLAGLVKVLPDPATSGPAASALSPTPRTQVRLYDLERAVHTHLAGIIAGLGLKGLEILCKALADAVRFSRRPEADEGVEDYSYIWRPRIEGGGHDDALEVLVTAVHVAGEQLVAQDAANVQRVLDALEPWRWQVFRRLELHVLTKLPAPAPDLVAARLLDRTLFDSFATCREYRMLLQRRFASLTEEQKAVWLGWIEAGLPADRIREFLERWGETPSDDEVARRQRRWQWDRFGVVREALPTEWLPRWQALEQEFGEPEPADRVDHSSPGISVGWRSPVEEDRIRAMSIAELTAFLMSWKQSPEQPLAWPEGLGQRLTNVVAQDPQRYAEEAEAFRALAPTYVRAVLGGFARASIEGRPFDWAKVLGLAEWVLQQPVVEPEPAWTGAEDPGWGWARGTVIRLLDEPLKREPSPLPMTARGVIWNLIETLCRDPNPERRGDALETAVRYASWIRVEKGQAWNGDGTLDDVPELRAVLDHALDLGAAPSPRVHEAVGHQLPWLIFMDEAWVRRSLARIFPGEPDQAALWQAAWRAYLAAGAPLNDRVFEALTPIYQEAVERLNPEEEATGALVRPEQSLAEQLALLHGRGTLEARGVGALLDRFFQKASTGLRRHFIWYVGHTLQEQTEAVPAEVLRRFQSLWQGRCDLAKTDPSAHDELRAFGMWFGCRLFDEAWALEQLEWVLREVGTIDHDHLVVERLAELAQHRAPAVMRCLGLLVRHLRDPGPVHGWLDGCKIILGAAIRSEDPESRTEAIEAFHRLGGLGFRAQELLPFSSDLDDPATIPYFTWDHPMTVAEIRVGLAEASEPERDRLLGQVLREAKDTDAWKFTTPEEVARRWPRIERHLGKQRAFWQLLLDQWKEQGLLAR
jgi:hypothetical protein